MPPTPPTTDVPAFLAAARDTTDRALRAWGDRARAELPPPVGDAVAYSLATPGKRLRPALVLAVFRELDGRGDPTGVAVAAEIVHTYSLVHDDLPCMDDDDVRRGRATVHRAFDVPTAAVAGWAMVPLAARALAEGARTLGLSADAVGQCGRTLFGAAGPRGMIGGQVMDLEAEGQALAVDALVRLHGAKTGALIAASAELGAVAAGAPAPVRAGVAAWGRALGLAFQIVDDVLDATAPSDRLGKTAGKDAAQGKATFVAALGVAEARAAAAQQVADAMDRLGAAGLDSPLLRGLSDFIANRRS